MASMSWLRACCERMERKIQDELGLTEAQCTFIGAMPAERSLNTGELCRTVGLSPSRGSRVIEDLVKRGLLARQADTDDRRIALVSLTTEGQRLKERIEALFQQCERAITRQLSPEELATVHAGLALLARVMEKQ